MLIIISKGFINQNIQNQLELQFNSKTLTWEQTINADINNRTEWNRLALISYCIASIGNVALGNVAHYNALDL